MRSRRLLATMTLPAALMLTACASSSTDGNGSVSGGGTPSSAPTDAKGLGQLLQTAALKVKTAHIALDAGANGSTVNGSGDEQLDNGKLTGLDLTETLPNNAGSLELIILNGKTYAKLPPDKNPTDKPWVLVTETSSNALIKQLATSIAQTESSASVGSVNTFVTVAKSVKKDGSVTIDGVVTTHYSVVVDPSKLPDGTQGKDALVAAGITELPIELYIDSQGRPVQVTEQFTAQGQNVSTKVTITKYDQPVAIQAPPEDQIAVP